MSLILIRKNAPTQAWLAALSERCPDLTVYVWPETGPVEDVEFVLTWAADHGVIAGFPNLKGIFSLGAGVDHILTDSTVPTHVPIARMIDSSLTTGMVQYVVMMVLQYQRSLFSLCSQQDQKIWKRPDNRSRNVGIMGMGKLGGACAQALAGMGYDVAGWSRSPKQIEHVKTFHGSDGLDAFLGRSHILICLLPYTKDLENVLNLELIEKLPRGAYLINAGRGEHLAETDLLQALDEGLLDGAALDVFLQEPLAPDHPFWSRPEIVVTPHIASMTVPETAVEHVAKNIDLIRAGAAPLGLVDRAQGY